MRPPNEDTGFAPPAMRPLVRAGRVIAMAELVASIGLAAGTIVAATVITAGIARADGIIAMAAQQTSAISFAVVIGLPLAAGGLTAMCLFRLSRRALPD